MSRISRTMFHFLICFGLLQIVPVTRSECSADIRCVPEESCEPCKQLKCTLAQKQGLKNVDCTQITPLIGGNQCCSQVTLAQLRARRKRQVYNFDNEPQRKWSNPVSYAYDNNIGLESFLANIPGVLSYIQTHTCLRFNKVDANSTIPHIMYSGGSACTAYVGRSDFTSTVITATSDCLSKFGEMLYYTVQTLGMWHQSQRPDRDDYIKVNLSNVDPSHRSDFSTLGPVLTTLGLPYDLASIQHFPATMYTMNGFFTILTNDQLYQQTIGQKVQLSFQDIKLLNLVYCKDNCSASQLSSSCQNGGYQDPNNCAQCKCPDGFAGQFCDQFETATGGICGGLVTASLTEMNISSPGYVSPRYYDSQIACSWHILASAGGNISLRFVGEFGVYQDSSYSCYHWVEIRYKNRLNETGPRFCGQSLPQVELVSQGPEVLIIFRSNLSGIESNLRRGFQISYKIVNAPVCAYITCLNGGSCVDGNCVCRSYTTGARCESRLPTTASSSSTSTSAGATTRQPPPPPTSLLSPSSSSSSSTTTTTTTTLSSPSPPSSCNPNPCWNNGTCSVNGNDVICTCSNGFTGQYCTKAPCGGCNLTPGYVDPKCVIPESPPRSCQVQDYVDSTSGFFFKRRRVSKFVTRNVTCTWVVCCDNAKDFGYGCGVLGWTDWCSCSASCGGGTQIRQQYGTRSDRVGNLFYEVVKTESRSCNTQKCVCDNSSTDDGARGDRGGSGGRGSYPWWWYWCRIPASCSVCNSPNFVESSDQCVKAE